ncbi:MAG: hypothetical protein SVU32_07125 [Candidatus Nanohaloarchaea archaeon]|nr:hypothetical protein [Candidatus Nanohaloarchaea archaeon]
MMEESINELREALVHPLKDWRAAGAVALVASLMYVVMMWGTYPAYFTDLVGADIFYLDNAIVAMTQYNLATTGVLGLGMTVLYAVLTGILAVNIGSQVYIQGASSLMSAPAAIPGTLAAGCASCGVGLIGLFGFAGVLTMLPFHGNLVRLAGILIILFVLQRMGNPMTCRTETALI